MKELNNLDLDLWMRVLLQALSKESEKQGIEYDILSMHTSHFFLPLYISGEQQITCLQ